MVGRKPTLKEKRLGSKGTSGRRPQPKKGTSSGRPIEVNVKGKIPLLNLSINLELEVHHNGKFNVTKLSIVK